MNSFFAQSWWEIALRGVLAILFGILAAVVPGLTLLGLIALFAAFALLSGISAVAGAARYRRANDDWWLPLLLGLVSIGAGIVALVNPALTALALVLIMGANALVTGVLEIIAAVRLRKVIEGEWMMALSGIVSIVFGALVFLFPGAGALALVWLISLYAILSGILLLALSVKVQRLARRGQLPPGERRGIPDRRISPAH
ncbi:HdeD family acid-resistance protein [Massilia horti]|uniref:HdeD family acid-resistance protein n=1 Tax=Massilia horti TaxID=2562153 RepID=A0A4Y9T186_9BURK|nr:HdeD family acid-resistance protein [Massilia horti]TFW32657.1 HdeD family acid-resistance protein [Massilia horti]